jgi:hypothetical protein
MRKGIRRTLFDYFKNVLINSEDRVYDVEGLAERLDPLMAIEARERWFENPFGEMMRKIKFLVYFQLAGSLGWPAYL